MVLTETNRPVEKPKAKRSKYAAQLAQNADEVRRAQRLRFEVFNLELNEGLVESHFTGLDVDPFDNVCDHLIVEHLATGEIVGTYRLQTARTPRRTSAITASASLISRRTNRCAAK